MNLGAIGHRSLAHARPTAILAAQMPASPVKTSLAAPERSLDQRMEALKRANDIRTARAKLKKDLKASRASIHSILLDPPEYVLTAKVFDMLLAVPKYGRVKTNRILNQCRISPSKTIGGLSQRQRTELVGLLRR
jgi:S13-like H2TH domain